MLPIFARSSVTTPPIHDSSAPCVAWGTSSGTLRSDGSEGVGDVKFRWRVFYSHIVAIAVVVLVVAISVRSIAVGAISAHLGGMMSLVSRSTEIAVTEGVTEALLWAAAAGVAVAIVASFAVSGWLTSTLG